MPRSFFQIIVTADCMPVHRAAPCLFVFAVVPFFKCRKGKGILRLTFEKRQGPGYSAIAMLQNLPYLRGLSTNAREVRERADGGP